MTKRQRWIAEVWVSTEESDMSTEKLYALVEDITGADSDEITEALIASGLVAQD